VTRIDLEKPLKAAFATNDLRRICKAIDVAIVRCGISDIARAAGIHRTSLYRAFRLKNGPRLDRMVKVLRVLGFRLVVQADGSQFRARETTRILTAAFRSGDLHIVSDAFAKILNAQENVSELAQKTIRTRETLYRAFTHPRIPRFSTVLTLVKALGLQLGVEPLPPKI
jgi:probable addiction module antidote protein